MHQITALPKISILQLSAAQRAIGRMTTLNVSQEPQGDAQTDLAGDIFHALYQSEPRSADQVPDDRAVNKSLIDWAQSMKSWDATRANTIANLPVSMATSGLMWEMLSSEDAIAEALKRQERSDRDVRQAEQLEAQAMGYEAAGAADKAGSLRESAKDLRAASQSAAREAARSLKNAQQDDMTNAAVAQAVREAGKQGQQMAEALAGWGFGPGSDVRSDPRAALEFARRNVAKVRQIALLAGRLRGLALQARRERVTHGVVPSQVGLTRDLRQVFPSELALLRPNAPAVLRAQKIAQFTEAGLIGWQLRGDAEKRGPFVAAVDVSGSMRGQRETIAKAIALGVAQAAKAEGRPYILLTFGSDSDPVCVVESSQSWQQHLEWAEYSRGGGTSFDRALLETVERLHKIGKRAKGADALFISDGEARVNSGAAGVWNTYKRTVGARLLYVPVARGYGSMEKFADRVIPVGELDTQAGADITRGVACWLR